MVFIPDPNPAARGDPPPECLMLERNPEIVAAGVRFVTGHLVAQGAAFTFPVGGKRLVLRAGSGRSRHTQPIGLIACVVTMKVRPAVVGEIEELERGAVSLELRCVWRIEYQVGRLLSGRRQSVGRLLTEAR